jgi:hypothetical protein
LSFHGDVAGLSSPTSRCGMDSVVA